MIISAELVHLFKGQVVRIVPVGGGSPMVYHPEKRYPHTLALEDIPKQWAGYSVESIRPSYLWDEEGHPTMECLSVRVWWAEE